MIDVDEGLTDEMRQVRDTVHRFALDVMRPAAVALDHMPDPADVIAPTSVLWDVFRRFKELGIGDPEAVEDFPVSIDGFHHPLLGGGRLAAQEAGHAVPLRDGDRLPGILLP